jgi:hypothetical protein
VRYVDAINRVVGRFAMYLIFVMMGVLLFSSISRGVFNVSHIWVVEMAQMTMAAYYILGGGYSVQLESHVRMDLDLLPDLSSVWRHIQYPVRHRIRSEELLLVGTAHGAHQDHHDLRHRHDAAADHRDVLQGSFFKDLEKARGRTGGDAAA